MFTVHEGPNEIITIQDSNKDAGHKKLTEYLRWYVKVGGNVYTNANLQYEMMKLRL